MAAFAVPLFPCSRRGRPPIPGAVVSGRPSTSIQVKKRPRAICEACVASPTAATTNVESGYWDWEGYGRVHYRRSSPPDNSDNSGNSAVATVLFVPGFGCGTFHFEANVADLAMRGFRVYAMDKLGLGQSTVENRHVAENVTLELWRNQITAFIENVLLDDNDNDNSNGNGGVFVVGNSLGGLLVASAANERPELFSGCVFLNSAPFWLSIPAYLRGGFGYIVENIWWNQLTKPTVLKDTLQLVYYKTVDPKLVEQILAPTRRLFAKTIFRSILTSPPLPRDFDTSVSSAFSININSIPLACINGFRDPWVGPIWGMRIKEQIPNATVYELDPVGHCPHDEAPKTVDFLIAHWTRSVLAEQPPATFGNKLAPVILDEDEGIRVSTKTAPVSFWDRFANSYGVFGTFVLATLESIRL